MAWPEASLASGAQRSEDEELSADKERELDQRRSDEAPRHYDLEEVLARGGAGWQAEEGTEDLTYRHRLCQKLKQEKIVADVFQSSGVCMVVSFLRIRSYCILDESGTT